MKDKSVKSFLLGLSVSVVLLASFLTGAMADRVFNIKPLDWWLGVRSGQIQSPLAGSENTPLADLLKKGGDVSIPDVVDAASESVLTVSIKKQQQVFDPSSFFNFGPFGFSLPSQGQIEEIQKDIGTGFVVDDSGLVVTNRHVVADTQAEYRVFDSQDNEYQVTKIYRDPINDLAIIQVDGLVAKALSMGDSSQLRVGESVIAIGTALGEFRHTVTTGVISGLGRGITAGDGISSIENLENVIQTDAAINPGNSGGPLINSRGEVIGVNIAVSQSAENIGFAIPINVVTASLKNFNETGQFDRPMLGVSYRMISEQTAIFNDVPQGAYLVEVMVGLTADKAGLKPGDIIITIDGESLKDGDLVQVLNNKRVGDKVSIRYFRQAEEKTVEVVLMSEVE
ncbi:MAG: trypsin-like peptidase domain-containing protein [Patescibacteria group bacterium]|nr:trypsin-like peptidase domain-containing protein [Patescibacteria group bacterium]